MAKYQTQEHVVYVGAQYPDYAGESGMIVYARETHRGISYLVQLDNGAQIYVPEDALTLPDAPVAVQEAQQPAQSPETPVDTALTPSETVENAPDEEAV